MRRFCTGLLAAALLISGCTSDTDPAPDADREQTFNLGGGATLTAPAGAFPDDVQLRGGPVTTGLLELPELPSAGSVEVSTSAQPGEPVTVEVPVDPAAYADLPPEGDDAILVAHQHDGEPWEPLLGQLDRDRAVVSVTTDRLSLFDVRLPSVDGLREAAGKILNGILGNIDFSADKPRCDGEQKARDAGYTVTSTSSSVLFWCLGLRADGSPELKVVANRRYPLVLTHAPGLTVRDTTPGELGVRLGQAATAALTTGQVTLSPAGTTTFDIALTPGQAQRMVADYDGFAQAMTTAAMMAQSVITIASWAGGPRAAKEFMDATLNAAGCTPALLDLAGDVTDEGRLGAMFSACFDPGAIRNQLGRIAGTIILSVASFFGAVAAYIWNGATAVVDQIRGTSSYTIAVTRAAAAPPAATGGDVLRFDGIGDLTLSLTADDLTTRGYVNEGNLYEGMDAACVPYAHPDGGPRVSVEAATGRVLAITNFDGDDWRTQVGDITAGDTVADVRAAFTGSGYQLEEFFDADFGQGSNGLVVTHDGGAIGLGVDGDGDTAEVAYVAGVGVPGHAPSLAETGC